MYTVYIPFIFLSWCPGFSFVIENDLQKLIILATWNFTKICNATLTIRYYCTVRILNNEICGFYDLPVSVSRNNISIPIPVIPVKWLRKLLSDSFYFQSVFWGLFACHPTVLKNIRFLTFYKNVIGTWSPLGINLGTPSVLDSGMIDQFCQNICLTLSLCCLVTSNILENMGSIWYSDVETWKC